MCRTNFLSVSRLRLVTSINHFVATNSNSSILERPSFITIKNWFEFTFSITSYWSSSTCVNTALICPSKETTSVLVISFREITWVWNIRNDIQQIKNNHSWMTSLYDFLTIITREKSLKKIEKDSLDLLEEFLYYFSTLDILHNTICKTLSSKNQKPSCPRKQKK